MKLQERSYSSTTFRPKPFVHQEADGSLLIVATSWGVAEHGALVAEEIAKYVTAARGDVEVTSPFEFQPSISSHANYLRIGTMMANEILYRAENNLEYVSGVEVLALLREGSEVAWAQVGAPHLLLARGSRPLVPLSPAFDHSFDLNISDRSLPPLPSRLLGVEPTCQIAVGDLQVSDRDSLVMLASSILPRSLWLSEGKMDLASVTRHMVQENPDSPFWLGLVEF